jgi:hypothetical protein
VSLDCMMCSLVTPCPGRTCWSAGVRPSITGRFGGILSGIAIAHASGRIESRWLRRRLHQSGPCPRASVGSADTARALDAGEAITILMCSVGRSDSLGRGSPPRAGRQRGPAGHAGSDGRDRRGRT